MVQPCWTVTHFAPKPLPRLAHALRSAATHAHHHGIRTFRHAVTHPAAWIETVCRAVPFVIAPAILTVPVAAEAPVVHVQRPDFDASVAVPIAGPSTLITLPHSVAPPPPDAYITLAPYVVQPQNKPAEPSNPANPAPVIVPSTITQIPEPPAMAVLLAGLSALLLCHRHRRPARITSGAAKRL